MSPNSPPWDPHRSHPRSQPGSLGNRSRLRQFGDPPLRFPPLALQVEASYRVAALIQGAARYGIPAPHIEITAAGQVRLTFTTGDATRDRDAVDLIARTLRMVIPLYDRDTGIYATENAAWRVAAVVGT